MNFLSTNAPRQDRDSKASQITDAHFIWATCVMTTPHGVQSSFVEEIPKPTMSLLPAAYGPSIGKYQLLSLPDSLLDNALDIEDDNNYHGSGLPYPPSFISYHDCLKILFPRFNYLKLLLLLCCMIARLRNT